MTDRNTYDFKCNYAYKSYKITILPAYILLSIHKSKLPIILMENLRLFAEDLRKSFFIDGKSFKIWEEYLPLSLQNTSSTL